MLFLLPADAVLADFAGGDGSAADPWQIATASQLDEIRNDLAAHYILTANVDLAEATGGSSGAFWNGGAGWEPIGRTRGDSFVGSLDGNGFTIRGLFIDRGGEDHVGLFGWIGFGAELTGLVLEEVDITGASLVGALAVTNFGGTIDSSHVTGSVSGNELVGGLLGRNLSGTVTDSHVTGTVTGNDRVDDLVALNWSTVTGSQSDSGTESPGNDRDDAGENYAVAITGAGGGDAGRMTGFIDSIRLPEEFGPGAARPDSHHVELTIAGGGVRATLMPYRVQEAFAGQDDGIFINEDGDVVWVTADRREVSSYPLLADTVVFHDVLEDLGLELQYGERASMRLSPTGSGQGDADYLSARAGMLAVPATSAEEEGLYFRAVPGLPNVSMAYLVFTDDGGSLMQQDLVPVPADWSALKAALAATPGISDVRMDPGGVISVSVGGQTVSARTGYEVDHGAVGIDEPEEKVLITPVGDVNRDGMEDFQVRYPGGDSQVLLVFP